MEFHCPDCGLPIQAADLAPAQGVAVCRFCEKPFPLEACQAAVPFADRHVVPVMTPPKGVDLVETMDGFRLTLSTRSCIAIFLVPFTLVWAGGSLGGIYGMQIKQGKFDLMMSLFGLPFFGGVVLPDRAHGDVRLRPHDRGAGGREVLDPHRRPGGLSYPVGPLV